MQAHPDQYHGRTDAVHHTDPECPRGRQVPPEWKVVGTGGLPLCPVCRARQAARFPSRPHASPEPGSPAN
jgi:hypothetical protein